MSAKTNGNFSKLLQRKLDDPWSLITPHVTGLLDVNENRLSTTHEITTLEVAKDALPEAQEARGHTNMVSVGHELAVIAHRVP